MTQEELKMFNARKII